MDSLWGEEFKTPEKPKTKKIIDKIKKEKERPSELTTEKLVKNKKVSFSDKALAIKEKVYNVLGKQINNVRTIYNKDELHQYLVNGLKYGRIAIDTETNNSLDPITCKLMGLCLYVKDTKQVYVPVNHVNPETRERLSNQLTEQDIHDELVWLTNNKGDCKFIFHNGKFDYQVLKETCNIICPIDWDTQIGAKLIDENENAKLKVQYIDKIDKDQQKYDIENLFEHLEYCLFEPELFALYAATDAMMTDRLYEYQLNRFKDPDLKRVYNLFLDVEIPLIPVLAEVELRGVFIDLDYSVRLAQKYHQKLDIIDKKLEEEINKLKPKIDSWRLTPEANEKIKSKDGNKEGKTKSEQLPDVINYNSPTQLAILFYDILKAPVVNKKKPRSTGEEELIELSKKLKNSFCDTLLERRGLNKLITGYIDTIPELALKSPDGRARTHFNQYGAKTGRLSSSEPINLQNIPSHNKEIRMLFKATVNESVKETEDDSFEFNICEEVLTPSGYVKVKDLKVGDIISNDVENYRIMNIITDSNNFKIIVL